jgi:hypothetical protein
MLFIENLSNNEAVPNVAKTAILYFDSIEAKFFIHYL